MYYIKAKSLNPNVSSRKWVYYKLLDAEIWARETIPYWDLVEIWDSTDLSGPLFTLNGTDAVQHA